MDVLEADCCKELLGRALFADIAVISGGRPYVTPISFVFSGDTLFFRSGPGERMEALGADPAACVSVVAFHQETGAWESVIVRGEVSFLEDEEALGGVVSMLLEKYRRYEPAIGIALPELTAQDAITFSMSLTDMTGRCSGASLVPRTRPGRL